MGQGARGVLARPARAAGDVEDGAALGVLAAPSTIAFLAAGSTRASAVARNRVPTSAPAAPSASAAATPRPSAIPPAASTGTGAARSTTTGHERQRGPAVPGAVAAGLGALGHDDVGAEVHRLPGFVEGGHLDDQHARPPRGRARRAGRDRRRTASPRPAGDSSARSTVPLSTAQLWKPTPQGARRAAGHDRQLAGQPVRVTVAAAEQPEPAGVARPPPPAPRPLTRPSAPARSDAAPRTVP